MPKNTLRMLATLLLLAGLGWVTGALPWPRAGAAHEESSAATPAPTVEANDTSAAPAASDELTADPANSSDSQFDGASADANASAAAPAIEEDDSDDLGSPDENVLAADGSDEDALAVSMDGDDSIDQPSADDDAYAADVESDDTDLDENQ